VSVRRSSSRPRVRPLPARPGRVVEGAPPDCDQKYPRRPQAAARPTVSPQPPPPDRSGHRLRFGKPGRLPPLGSDAGYIHT
jgi:hypothetical protein